MHCIQVETPNYEEFLRIGCVMSYHFNNRYSSFEYIDSIFYITCWGCLDWFSLADLTILCFGIKGKTTTEIQDNYLLLTIKADYTNCLVLATIKLF